MCPDGTQCRQGSPDAPDATRCGVLVQDAQDGQDAGSRLGEPGRNTTGSDAGHLFADVIESPVRSSGYEKLFLVLASFSFCLLDNEHDSTYSIGETLQFTCHLPSGFLFIRLASRQPPSCACTVAVAPGHSQTSIPLFFEILVSQPCFLSSLFLKFSFHSSLCNILCLGINHCQSYP